MRGSASSSCAARPKAPPSSAADGQRRGEVAGAAARADGQRRRHQLGQRQQRQQLDRQPAVGQPGGAGDGHLDGAVAAAEDARSPARRCPPGRPRPAPAASPTGPAPGRPAPAASTPGTGQAHGGLAHQLQRSQRRRWPARRPAAPAARTAAGAPARTGSAGPWASSVLSPKMEMTTEYETTLARTDGHQRVRLEAVAVQHLDRQQRGPQRRAEHRRDAGRHAGHQQDAPLARADRQQPRHQRAQRAADQHGRPLAPARRRRCPACRSRPAP